MCHRQILEIVHQQFGGVLREGVRSNPKHNNIWIWQLYGGKAGELLIKLQPYLIVKQERVKLFLEYLQRKSKQKGSSKGRPRNESWYSQEFHEYSEEVFQRLKSMNKKGKHEI